MCANSLDILNRTVMVATNPRHSEQEIADIIHNIGIAARVALGGMPIEEADLRATEAVDAQKFDTISPTRPVAKAGSVGQAAV
jgi:hypothetical protein